MPKEKDYIVRRKDGLYLFIGLRNEVFWTDKKNADHFASKSLTMKQYPSLKYFTIQFINLKDKRKGRSLNGKAKKKKKEANPVL